MSENEQRHVPPQGMVNVSGPMVRDLVRGVMNQANESFNIGLSAEIAAQVILVCAVDVWRANYGDAQCREVLVRAIERRLEMPTEFWGGTPQKESAG